MKKLIYILALFLGFFCSGQYFVTTSGSSGNNGTSEATAWSIAHAFANAPSGSTVNIKAGNYGSAARAISAGGTSGNPTKYIGYTNTAGDIVSVDGSTFSKSDNVNSAIMPLIDGTSGGSGVGLGINDQWVELHNFQVKDFLVTVNIGQDNVLLKNVITQDSGDQTTDAQGVGMRAFNADNVTFEDCFSKNAGSINIQFYNSSNSLATHCYVYNNNSSNPGGYYLFRSAGTRNTIIEYCTIERAQGLAHGGHGFIDKFDVQDCITRYCTVLYTNMEFNYSDVKNNLYHDITIQGISTSASEWHTNLDFRNGANNNTLRNFYIKDTYTAVQFIDFDDGYVPPYGPDTDEVNCGFSNTLENFVIENTVNVVNANGNTILGGSNDAPFNDNVFRNWTVDNYGTAFVITQPNSGNTAVNMSYRNGAAGLTGGGGYTNNVSVDHSNFFNAPSMGINSTTHDPQYENIAGGALDYRLSSSSQLRDIGIVGSILDYEGNSRNGNTDIGAFEFGGTPTTPTCSDGIQNGTETGIDCGGSCAPCTSINKRDSFFGFGN